MTAQFEPAIGRYMHLDLFGRRHRLHVEEARGGTLLLCLHTAGADEPRHPWRRNLRRHRRQTDGARRARRRALEDAVALHAGPALSDEYDYSCTPEETLAVAAGIPGCQVAIMKSLGHFAMSENPRAFLQYLRPVLEKIEARAV